MANYYETARSNYFRVTDKGKFQEFLDKVGGLEFIEQEDRVGFLCDDGVPCSWRPNGEDSEHVDLDFFRELSKHLVQGEVAIVVVSGHEKMRYITGWATAVNSKGTFRSVSIDDIYSKARALTKTPSKITRAEY